MHTPVETPTAVGVTLFNYPGAAINGITYGGVSLTLFATGTTVANGSTAQLWGLANPPAGAQTVTVTFANTGAFFIGGSITVTGSDTTTVFSNTNAGGGSSTTPSISVATTVTTELVIDVVGNDQNDSETQGGSQTLRWGPLTAPNNEAASSSQPSGASGTTMSWTQGGGAAPWSIAAGSFKVAAAAATSGGNLPMMGVGHHKRIFAMPHQCLISPRKRLVQIRNKLIVPGRRAA